MKEATIVLLNNKTKQIQIIENYTDLENIGFFDNINSILQELFEDQYDEEKMSDYCFLFTKDIPFQKNAELIKECMKQDTIEKYPVIELFNEDMLNMDVAFKNDEGFNREGVLLVVHDGSYEGDIRFRAFKVTLKPNYSPNLFKDSFYKTTKNHFFIEIDGDVYLIWCN